MQTLRRTARPKDRATHGSNGGTLTWAPIFLLTLLASCNIGEGFTELGDNLLAGDAALLDRPGRRLRKGSYSDLTIDGSLDEGGRVLALHHTKDETGLAIVPFLDGDACDVFPAVQFERVSSRVDIDLSAMVAVQTSVNESGRGTIRFVDFECQDVLSSIEDAGLPRAVFPETSPTGLLLLTGSLDLHLIDVKSKELTFIAHDVQSAQASGTNLWTLENGVLVGRDQDLEKFAELGSNVTEYIPQAGGDDVVFVEGGELFGWSRSTSAKEEEGAQGDLRKIAEDVCGVSALAPKVLSYLSPCDARRLELEVQGEAVGLDLTHVKLRTPDGVLLRFPLDVQLGSSDEPSHFMLIQSEDPAALSGDLLVATLPPAPEVDGDGVVELSFDKLESRISFVQDTFLQDWDGTKGTLMEPVEDDGVVTGLRKVKEGIVLLPGRAPFNTPGVLLDFDGTSGTLAQLSRKDGKTSTKEFTSGVPIQFFTTETDTDAIAYVGDLNPETNVGIPYLLTSQGPLATGKASFVNTLRFLDQPRALAYLAPKGDSGAELHAYLIEAGIDMVLAAGVNEYRGLPWPSPGILYSVWEGDNAGLWFSKAR
jgi:hypothetical protein